MRRRALPWLLAGLLLAGCMAAPPAEPRTHAETTVERVHLEGSLERAQTQPGQALVANLHLTNRGAPIQYEEGGCASAPWTFEILAENGTRVGPVEPDPRCLGEPMRIRGLATGEATSHAFSWDANRKWYDEEGALQREPVSPGLYTLRAEVVVARDGVRLEPEVQLVFRVG